MLWTLILFGSYHFKNSHNITEMWTIAASKGNDFKNNDFKELIFRRYEPFAHDSNPWAAIAQF